MQFSLKRVTEPYRNNPLWIATVNNNQEKREYVAKTIRGAIQLVIKSQSASKGA